jgi:inward rectifier potassium channel
MRALADDVERGDIEMISRKPERRANPMRGRQASFELLKSGVVRFDLRDRYRLLVAAPWPAFSVVMALNIIFALLYALRPGAVQNLAAGDVVGAFFFSLETLATVGYGEMAPASFYGHVVASIEILFGMTFMAIFTGILFVRFSRPKAKIHFPDNIVVTPHNGQLTLMVRIANGRLTMLTHASANLTGMVGETNQEGQFFRRVYNLELVRENLPIFPLTWTLMHVVDETSPLYGLEPDDLEARQARVFLTIEARDVAIGAQVHDVHGFTPQQIKFGMRYTDAVLASEAGSLVADLSKLSLVE